MAVGKVDSFKTYPPLFIIMNAMTKNTFTDNTWWKDVALNPADLKTHSTPTGDNTVGAGKLSGAGTDADAITSSNTLTLAKTETAGKFEVGEAS